MNDINPFIYDDPLPPDKIVNREEETKQLVSLAEGGHNTRIQAPRRYGKTSLLLKVIAEAKQIGMETVYIDFYRALTPAQIIVRIDTGYTKSLRGPVGRTVQNVLRKWRGKIKVAPGGVGAEAEYLADADQERQLGELLDLPKRIYNKTGNRTLVIFDEFQDFLRAEGDLDGLIRSKIQFHRDEASYIFAGSEPGMLEALFGDKSRPLYDQARRIGLSPLADDDLSDYIGERFEAAGRDPGEALGELLDLVRGHPQRAMLMAHHLFELTPRGDVADADTFAAAYAAVKREKSEQFEALRKALPLTQVRVLAALASGGALFSSGTLKEVGLKKGSVQQALDALIGSGDVLHEPGSEPVIVDPLFERWLQEDLDEQIADFVSELLEQIEEDLANGGNSSDAKA